MPFIKIFTFVTLLCLGIPAAAQGFNSEVEAKININESDKILEVVASARNKTNVSQTLRYVLSVNRTDVNGNQSKEEQNGRFVLNPLEKKNLSKVTASIQGDDKVIILLLIYDLYDTILGKDRLVFNDEGDDYVSIIQKEELAEIINDVDAKDIGVLRGIVIEDTKTKAGRDFYKAFTDGYRNNNINGDKIVTVKEVLSLGRNTKIEVLVAERIIVEFNVNPRSDFLQQMANFSLQRVVAHFEKLEREKTVQVRY